MESLLLVALAAGAAYAFLGRDRLEQLVAVAHSRLPHLEVRHIVGAGLLALLAFMWAGGRRAEPTPAPGPAPDAPIVLAGKFSAHPEAAADAARIEALFGEIADELEWDAAQAEPLYRSGVSFDELRVRAFDLRMKGESIGARHPRVRDEIRAFLDRAAGTSGGPLTPAQKSAWVAAFREVERAAAEATRSGT